MNQQAIAGKTGSRVGDEEKRAGDEGKHKTSKADFDPLKAELVALDKKLKKDPKNVDLLLQVATIFKKMDMADYSIQYIDRALEAEPDHADALNLKGEALLALDSTSEAIYYFTRAINANPTLEKAWFNKAIVLGQNGIVDEAIYNFDMVLKINPGNEKASQIRKSILEIKLRPKRVWLFVGTEETWDTKFKMGGTWGMHGNAPDIDTFFKVGQGDLILAFKRKPSNAIFAFFEVKSHMYTDYSTMWPHRIDIEPTIKLKQPISLTELKDSSKLAKTWNFIMKPDRKRAIFEIEPETWEFLKEIILKINSDLQPEALAIEKAIKEKESIYHLDVNEITNKVVVSPSTIMEIETHLKSGRNLILYGPQGSGKETLANLVAEQVCGKRIQSKGHDLYNYTIKMTNPLWEEDEIIGYWESEADKKVFRKGFGTQAVEWCAESMRNSDRPHYLILNKMDRIDLDRAFNRFLNVVGEKDTSVVLSHLRGETITLRMPKEFRIIGTANCEGWAIPNNLVPLKGQFSFIEVGMPEKKLEYEKIPFLVRERLLYHDVLNTEDLMSREFKKVDGEISRFDNDQDGEIQKAYDMLMAFVSKDKFPPKGTVIPRGVRTYKAIGTQLLVETMVCVANTPPKADVKHALENAIISIFLPLLEAMEVRELYNIQLRAKEVFGMRSKVVEMLSTLIGKQTLGGEIEGEEGDMKVDDWADEGEMDDYYISADEVNNVEITYDIDLTPIFDQLSISKKTLNQILVNLESGRNIILYGAPGCGKTKVATLLCEQLCGRIQTEDGGKKPNYTIITANAEWDNYDIVGGVAPKVDEYTHEISYEFRDGCVTAAVKECLKSLKRIGKTHHLIIDEFNRANIDEAFGKLFTIFEYRDTQSLLTAEENKGNPLHVPNQFRIIGTMNVQDKNTLFDIGHALMRRYAFIEVGLPEKEDEFNRMPHFIDLRSKEMGITLKGEKTAKSMFKGDVDGKAEAEYRKLMRFLEEEKMPEEGVEVPVGVRTYRKIGTAQVIDCVIWILKASGDYSKEEAMQDAIIANVLPQLENLEKAQLSNIYMKAVDVFGERSKIAHAVDRMRKSTTLSIFS